ncbi:MAG: hypothetical protein EOM51_04685 [Clostridia bacterium]|nr:hypothetical protein [Clostridia bacterium]
MKIETLFSESRRTYGYRKMQRALAQSGTEISVYRVRKMMRENGIISSMSRPGCPYDNTCAESFFVTIKKECIYRRRYVTMEEVRRDMFSYVELFYNRKHMHSVLGYLSPFAYRRKNQGGEAA